MSLFSSLASFLLGLYGMAFVGAQMFDAPPPPPPNGGGYSATTEITQCPEVTPCPPGFVSGYDQNGCSNSICQEEYTDERCIKDQQRSLEDFNRYNIKDGERRLKELTRNKLAVPAEVQGIMDQMKAGYSKAQVAGNCQDLSFVVQDLYQISNDFNDKIRDVEDAMNNVRCVKDSQRELNDFERHNIKNNEDKIKKATQKKIAVPPALAEMLPKLKELLATARKANNCSDLNEARNELYAINTELQDAGMQLEFLMQVPQMIKQVSQEVKNIERQWKTAANKAKRSKADLSDIVARGQSLFDSMKSLFEEFKAAMSSGEPERIRDMMERGDSEARDYEDEIFEIIRTVEALSNAPRYIKELDRRVKDTRRQAKDMTRFNKIDTSALAVCLDNAAPLIAAAKEESVRRPADPDAMMDAFAAIEEALSDCEEIRHSLEGTREEFFGEFVPDQIFGGLKGGGEGTAQPVR